MIITVEDARKLLGKKYDTISDKQLELIIKELEQLADIAQGDK